MTPGPPYSRPTREQLRAAEGGTTPDLLSPGLRVLFCGINPSLYSAAVGHHFARPGNRFWPALHAGGFTPRILHPWEEEALLESGCGITNIYERATATAAQVARGDLIAAGERLRRRVESFGPMVLAILGITAYRSAFARPRADYGPQPERIGETRVWVLPNPSGLNAHFQLPELGRAFGELWTFAAGLDSGRAR